MDTEDTTSPEEKLDTWAIIELFGHSQIAGKVSNVAIAGCGFIRVDVPEHGERKAYTRHVAPKAVYAINPCDETAARCALGHITESPVVAIVASDTYTRLRAEFEERLKSAQSRAALAESRLAEDHGNNKDHDEQQEAFNP